MFDDVIVTCEHGGNRVPKRYRELFEGNEDLLNSHRGYDLGALELARRIAKAGDWPLFYSTTTRLLCDLNRTFRMKGYLSEITEPLDWDTKDAILRAHYDPYRLEVETAVRGAVHCEGLRLLHLSVHTFTPVLNGEVRHADIGLLYDPQRAQEKTFCDRWRDELAQTAPELIVRRNYPYLGTADGFTSHLRFQYDGSVYFGIELEVNQRWPLDGGKPWKQVQNAIVTSLLNTLHALQAEEVAKKRRQQARSKPLTRRKRSK